MFKIIVENLTSSRVKDVSINDLKMREEELIYPEIDFHMPGKLDIFGQKHNNFSAYTCSIPSLNVRSIANAKCVVGNEEVFTSNDEVIAEYTTQKINPWIGRNKNILSNPKIVNGSVLNLSLSGLEKNYGHWLIECLSRFYLFKKSRFKPNFYILSNNLSFQKQFIEFLEIDNKKILELKPNTIIQADEIIVPSFINNWEIINLLGHKHYQKQWLPSWIRNIYREKIEPVKCGINKIYVSRLFAKYRKIENENEIIKILKNRGYKIYFLENMLVKDQIELFSNASIVLGAHGSGFSNMLFCPQNTLICELFSEHYHDSTFKILANVLGLEYYYMICKTNNIRRIHPQKENMYINLSQLESALNQLDNLAYLG
jgi:capsular polysaccharide biosynthesis protein